MSEERQTSSDGKVGEFTKLLRFVNCVDFSELVRLIKCVFTKLIKFIGFSVLTASFMSDCVFNWWNNCGNNFCLPNYGSGVG